MHYKRKCFDRVSSYYILLFNASVHTHILPSNPRQEYGYRIW